MNPTRAAALAIVLVFAAADASAQVLGGRVVDAASGAPIIAAVVRLLDEGGAVADSVATDASGAFRIQSAAAGTFRVSVRAPGYAEEAGERVVLVAGTTSIVTLRASADAVRLEPVVVEVAGRVRYLENVGFYDRQRYETGRFIDRAEIERLNPRRVADLLRGIVGTRIVESGYHVDVVMRGGLATTLGGSPANRQSDVVCAPEIYLDGMLISRGGPLGQAQNPRRNLNEILPADIEAIEVYASASRVPARFGGAHATCGVVLFWSRR
jgi:hypothetical protein